MTHQIIGVMEPEPTTPHPGDAAARARSASQSAAAAAAAVAAVQPARDILYDGRDYGLPEGAYVMTDGSVVDVNGTLQGHLKGFVPPELEQKLEVIATGADEAAAADGSSPPLVDPVTAAAKIRQDKAQKIQSLLSVPAYYAGDELREGEESFTGL